MATPNADQSQISWHTLSTENTLELLKAPADGLSHAEAAKRLAEVGPNRLPEAARRSGFLLLTSANILGDYWWRGAVA